MIRHPGRIPPGGPNDKTAPHLNRLSESLLNAAQMSALRERCI